MRTFVTYSIPETVTPEKVYITGERYLDGRFIGYIYHYGKLDLNSRG